MNNYDRDPLISVIIPTYNRADIILRAVNSVINQSYNNLEIIIVDDASTDNTESLIRKINDERITYHKLSVNSNGAVARNEGIDISNGEIITFLDSDDEWDKDKLRKQFDYYKNYDNNKFVAYTAMIEIDDYSEKISPKRGIKPGEDFAEYIFSNGGLIQTSTLMMHKSIIEKIKFNPSLKRHQDWDLFLRLQIEDYNFLYLNLPLATRYKENRIDRVANQKDATPSITWIENNKEYFSKKSYYAFYILTLSPILGEKWSKKFITKLLIKSLIHNSVSIIQWLMMTRFLFSKKIKFEIEKQILKIKKLKSK